MAATNHAIRREDGMQASAHAQPQAAKPAKHKLQLLSTPANSQQNQEAYKIGMRYWKAAQGIESALGIEHSQLRLAFEVAAHRARTRSKGVLNADKFHSTLVHQLSDKSGVPAEKIHTLLNNQIKRDKADYLQGKVDMVLMKDLGLDHRTSEARYMLQRDILLTLTSDKISGGSLTYKQLGEELGMVEGIGVKIQVLHALKALQRSGIIAMDRMQDERTSKTYSLITISESARAKLLEATRVETVKALKPAKPALAQNAEPAWLRQLNALIEEAASKVRAAYAQFVDEFKHARRYVATTAAVAIIAALAPSGIHMQNIASDSSTAQAAGQKQAQLATILQEHVSDVGIGMWSFKRDPLHYGFDWNPVVSFRCKNPYSYPIAIDRFVVRMNGLYNTGQPESGPTVLMPGEETLLKLKGPVQQVHFIPYGEKGTASLELQAYPVTSSKQSSIVVLAQSGPAVTSQFEISTNVSDMDLRTNPEKVRMLALYNKELKLHAKSLQPVEVLAHPQLIIALFGASQAGEISELHNAGLLSQDQKILQLVSQFQSARTAQAGKAIRSQFSSYVSTLYEHMLPTSVPGGTLFASAR
jgi:hypothetical protein